MKRFQKFALLTFALTLLAGSAFAETAPCCQKAKDAGKTCSHKCCVAAAKAGKECEKCGGKGELKKSDDKKAAKAK